MYIYIYFCLLWLIIWTKNYFSGGPREKATNFWSGCALQTLYHKPKNTPGRFFGPKYRSYKHALAVAETEYLLINCSAVWVANVFDLETVRTGAIRCREGRGGRLTGPSECQGPAAWFALPPRRAPLIRIPRLGGDTEQLGGRFVSRRLGTISNAINRRKIIFLTVHKFLR